ncbi:MAG: hypothetical protein QME44_06560, partial [Thermodesulfobacteriota bacterium]|nr:hypothetical protein [Thermodesulfobacteriota bacterium]
KYALPRQNRRVTFYEVVNYAGNNYYSCASASWIHQSVSFLLVNPDRILWLVAVFVNEKSLMGCATNLWQPAIRDGVSNDESVPDYLNK